jgi:hypothetical protein
MESPHAPLAPREANSAISMWGRFVSTEMEARFRSHSRPLDARQANIAVGLALGAILPFIPSDYRLLGFSSLFWVFLAMRLSCIVASVTLLVLFHKGISSIWMDRLLAAWCVAGSLGCLAIGYSRPAMYLVGFVLSSITLSLLLYFVIPLPLATQVAINLFSLSGNAYLLVLRHAELDAVLQRAIIVNCLLANFMGAMASWHLHRLRRQQFAALQREVGLRKGLEGALSQVKTLQGYLPICSHCKAVRNDEGYWQQVEVYVREHTRAEFTHGICPQCLKEHFGEALAARAS